MKRDSHSLSEGGEGERERLGNILRSSFQEEVKREGDHTNFIYHLHSQENVGILVRVERIQLLRVVVDVIEEWRVVIGQTGVPTTDRVTIIISGITSVKKVLYVCVHINFM